MMDDLFPETINKGAHGAEWWVGHWQCRNWHGYFQSREEGRGAWLFHVPWFSNDNCTCSVYRISETGQDYTEDRVPIDAQGRLSIRGQKWGRECWEH